MRYALLLLLAPLGCQLDLVASPEARIICTTAADCPLDLVCNEARRCVDPTTDAKAPGILVNAVGGLVTTEAGGTATVTFQLATRPSARVTVLLTTPDPGEVALSQSTISFVPEAWDAPTPVVLTGQPDCLQDGDQLVVVEIAPAISPDPDYDGLDPADLDVTNEDTFHAEILVNLSDTTTGEDGTSVTFNVLLGCAPTENVTLDLSSSQPDEGMVEPDQLVFSRTDWSVAKTVVATGVPDCAADGDAAYEIQIHPAMSADAAYEGLDADDVSLTNRDDFQAAVIVTPSPSMVTTETGGFATFNVELACAPSAAVTIPVASSTPTEGLPSPASLEFTPEDWSVAQTVLVTGVSDCQADGDTPYSVVLLPVNSADPNYDALDPPDVAVVNQNVSGVQHQLVPTANLSTDEGGLTATFEVFLPCDPVEDVVITFSSDNTDEGQLRQTGGVCAAGTADIADTPCTVTFTTGNWEIPVEVEVSGVDDPFDDDDIDYAITSLSASSNSEFDGRVGTPVSITNYDDDTAAVLLSPPSLAPMEIGGTESITVTLATLPLAPVTVDLASSNSGHGTVTASVVLDSSNWSAGATATVTAVNNNDYGSNPAYEISASTAATASTDPKYNDLVGEVVAVQNLDDDKRVFMDPTPRAGNFSTVATADGYCAGAAGLLGLTGVFKAMVGAGSRRACGTLGCPSGQVNWVFKPHVAYFRVSAGNQIGARVAVANADGLLDFPLESSFGGGTYWTGMYGNWQGMLLPCAAFGGFEDPWEYSQYTATTGSGSSTGTAAIGPSSGAGLPCTSTYGFVCVEQ